MLLMKNYNTLSEATNDLYKRGYTLDFNLKDNCIWCNHGNIQLAPEEFEVVELYRFEGMSSTDDNSVVYAIESKDGLKGLLVNAYGVYADTTSAEIIAKLDIQH